MTNVETEKDDMSKSQEPVNEALSWLEPSMEFEKIRGVGTVEIGARFNFFEVEFPEDPDYTEICLKRQDSTWDCTSLSIDEFFKNYRPVWKVGQEVEIVTERTCDGLTVRSIVTGVIEAVDIHPIPSSAPSFKIKRHLFSAMDVIESYRIIKDAPADLSGVKIGQLVELEMFPQEPPHPKTKGYVQHCNSEGITFRGPYHWPGCEIKSVRIIEDVPAQLKEGDWFKFVKYSMPQLPQEVSGWLERHIGGAFCVAKNSKCVEFIADDPPDGVFENGNRTLNLDRLTNGDIVPCTEQEAKVHNLERELDAAADLGNKRYWARKKAVDDYAGSVAAIDGLEKQLAELKAENK